MRCLFSDYRPGFSSILADKLGKEFEIDAARAGSVRKDCYDAIMIAIPPATHPEFDAQLCSIAMAARNADGVPVVALLCDPDNTLTMRVIGEGAYDCFVETSPLEELRIILRRAVHFHELTREVEQLRDMARGAGFEHVLTCNPGMEETCRLLAKVAPTSATVLLMGESGTGKGMMASAIHAASSRHAKPFVALSCASLPEHLIEAELFGHEKGAFTGAVAARRGRFEAAGQGTIFLDEIGDLPPSMQVKLLRVLQEKTFERLGSNEPRQMEARVICATHRPLKELVKSGAFRADLYYRISAVEVELPPLRKRREDILPIAHDLLRKYAARHRRPAIRFSPGVLAALQEHEWPGNIRELQNVIERAVLVGDDPELHFKDLPTEFAEFAAIRTQVSLEEAVRDFKRRTIQRALTETAYNKVQAARLLGISRSSLHRLIDELQIRDMENSLLHHEERLAELQRVHLPKLRVV
jgi:two-component system, NtrC family, response regulator